jgi:hypothetical protein
LSPNLRNSSASLDQGETGVYAWPGGGLTRAISCRFQLPDDPQTQRYLFAGLAFLAGFSERFAQDTVAQGKAVGVAQAPTMPTGAVR